MPKKTPVRIIDNRKANRATTISGVTLSAPAPGVSDHGLLLGLADDDHPQYLLADGTRTLTGNLAVGVGVTVDGVDISAHAADPSAHHAPVTAGTLIGLSGQQVSVAPGAAYQFIGTGSDTVPEWRNVSELAGNGLTAANGVLAVGVANTGAVGLSVEADAVRLTSSSNPGASASILASDANGYLQLVRLVASDRLRAPLIDTAAGNLTIQPAADIVLNPAGGEVRLAANRALQSDNYASQTTGMRITHSGEADFRYLFTDEMHAKSFIADLEQALAGGQIISKSVAVLATAFTAPAAGGTATLRVRDLPSAPDMACFQSGDIVRLRQFSRASGALTIADCWGTVTGYTDNADGTQSWTFTRSSAPNAGAMTAGTVIAADAIVLDYGTTGNGFYEVNAIDGAYGGNSPYAQIVSWSTHPATGATVRTRFGNLRGIFGAANEYGLYAGAGTATSDAYLRISNTEVGLYNLPLRMYTGGTERVHIAAHNDVWIGPSSDDKRLSWDGSTLTVTGKINVVGGNAATLDNVTGAINLVANASFETDTNNDGLADGFSIYNNDGAAVPTTASRVAGEKSTWAQRISWTGTNASTKGIYFNTGARRASTDYVITFWARTNTAVDLGIYHNVQPTTKTNLLWPTAGTSWQFYAARLQWASSNTDNWFLSIVYDGAAIANGWIEFDKVMVSEGSEIVPWAHVTGAINLVANASFETDTNNDGLADGFSIYNNDYAAVPTTASRVAGSKSTWAQRIAWTGTNATTKGIYFNAGTRRASTDYVITFWARTNTAVDLGIYHNVEPTTKTNLLWPTAGTSWQFYAARLQWASSNTDNWFLSIVYDGAAIANGWIEFDNVMVSEGSEIVPWALAPSDKANTALDNSVISTLISGANIRVGSGTKDSTLNGWNIDSTEIVGQAAGVDQVVMDVNGRIVAGAGAVRLDISGIGNEVGTSYGANSAYNFLSGGAVIGGMWAQNNAFGSLDVLIGANLVDPNSIWSYAVPNRTSGITLRSTAAAAIGYSANVVLEAINAYTSSVVSMAIQNSPSTGALINFSHTPTVGASMYKVWHAGNDGTGSGLDADLFHGMNLSVSGARWSAIAHIQTDGVMEIGKYIDFHESGSDTSDYSLRMYSDSGDLYVSSRIRSSGGTAGLFTAIQDDTSKYFAWYATGGSFRANHSVNGDLLRITDAGRLMVGNTADLYSAKIQTNGNVHAQGAVTSELYLQVRATTAPVAAAGWARIALRSSDNALVAIMPSGAVRVLATN